MTHRWTRSLLPTAWVLGALALPCATAAAQRSSPDTIGVMTWNIHFGNEGLSRVASTVCAARADIVGLQEVDVHWSERSAFEDQAARIAESCGMAFRFGPIYSLRPLTEGAPPREFGVAILTRLPIDSSQNHHLTRLSTQEPGTPPAPAPGFLQVTVDVRGTPVDVFVTHLDYRPDPSVRRWQERLNPLWRRLAGGCNLDRPMDRLIADAGFEFTRLERGYGGAGPRPFDYRYRGVAEPMGR